jgi:hypothetical protein
MNRLYRANASREARYGVGSLALFDNFRDRSNPTQTSTRPVSEGGEKQRTPWWGLKRADSRRGLVTGRTPQSPGELDGRTRNPHGATDRKAEAARYGSPSRGVLILSNSVMNKPGSD